MPELLQSICIRQPLTDDAIEHARSPPILMLLVCHAGRRRHRRRRQLLHPYSENSCFHLRGFHDNDENSSCRSSADVLVVGCETRRQSTRRAN